MDFRTPQTIHTIHEYTQKFESIRHEYAQKLETHKAELNAKMQALLYERQINQLRTSLFFDHQREAFASLLSQIVEIKRKWIEISDPEEGIIEPVPHEEYKKFKKFFYDNQLFLDSDCILAIDLVLEIMEDSFPFIDGSGDRVHLKKGGIWQEG